MKEPNSMAPEGVSRKAVITVKIEIQVNAGHEEDLQDSLNYHERKVTQAVENAVCGILDQPEVHVESEFV